MISKQQAFKDPTSLTKWLKWILYTLIVVLVIAIISGVLEYQLISDFNNGVYSSQEQAFAAGEASDARQGIVGIARSIVSIVSGILILIWIHRANYNARQLGAKDMTFTPGWSIAWYFIPFANLWKPYQAMKEIWKASMNPLFWSTESAPSALPWWWFFLIVSSFLGNTSLKMSMKAVDIDSLLTANVLTQLSCISQIPLCLFFISIMSRVYEMQMRHAKTENSI